MPTEHEPEPCPTCDGNGCEESCGRERGGCEDAYRGPNSHRVCGQCGGSGVRGEPYEDPDREADELVCYLDGRGPDA